MIEEEITYEPYNPSNVLLWVRERVQPSPFGYVWGGMEWQASWYQQRMQYGDKLVWDGEVMRLVQVGADDD